MELPGAELRSLVDRPAPGAWNMAVDEALLQSARGAVSTVRFYRWEPGCLSFGRNQTARDRYDPEAIAEAGVDVVRRPTGGRAVFHHREVTYSVIAPTGLWGSLRDCYERINRALTRGLRELGVPADLVEAGVGRAPRPTTRACFRDPVSGEVTAGGRKLVGSAQWRDEGAFLQHGSILLHDDQHLAESLRHAPPAARVKAASLSTWLAPLPSFESIVRALSAGFETEFQLPVLAGSLTPRERVAAGELQARYESPDWTWRR